MNKIVLFALTSFAFGSHVAPQPRYRAVLPSTLPVAFESIQGQVHPEGKFISQRLNYRVFLTPKDAVFAFSGTSQAPRALQSRRRAIHPKRDSMRLHLVGTNPHAEAEGRKTLPSYSNYLIGNDPGKWRTHVPQYAEVWYPAIYPGIDLVYYGSEGQLEYDFIVAPGANPDRIQFSLGGSESRTGSPIRLNQHGDLVIPGGDGEVLLHKPLLYQGKSCTRDKSNHADGESGCKVLQGGSFRLQRTKRSAVIVSFRLPAYDHTQPLVIDPAVSFSTYLGGGYGDGATGMALDAAGNIYLYGDTGSSDFPVTPGAYQTHLASPPDIGSADAFVTKISPDGSQILWSTYLGGSGDESPTKVAVDSEGSVYVTGTTQSPDFPLASPFQSQLRLQDAFVSKLSPDGTKLIYSTYFGGSSQEYAMAIAVDEAGQAVIAGSTGSLDLPVANAWQPTHASTGPWDGFVTKFSADGASLIFSTYLGGKANDWPMGMALDPSANVYVTGFSGADFPITPNAYQTTCNAPGASCTFVSKLSPSGQDLAYSTFINYAEAHAITVNASGNAFVTGDAVEGFTTTPGAFQTEIGNPGIFDPDVFVTELDATGTSAIYSTFLGGNNIDWGWAIAVDSSNNVYLTGQTHSTNFPLQSPVQTFIEVDPLIFVSELNNTGSSLLFSTYWGGSPGFGDQQGNAIAVDSVGNIIVAGYATVPDFPVVNPIQAQLKGPGDAIVVKFEFTPDFGVAGSPDTVTISAGGTATYTLTLTPVNDFNGQISLSCSGGPAHSTCAVSPTSVTLDGVNSSPATVTVKTTAPSRNAMAQSSGFKPLFTSLFALAALCLAARPLNMARRRSRVIAVLTGLMLTSVLLISCGGGSNGGSGGGGGGGTPPGTYTISVKANSGTLNRELKLQLVVK